jgi:ABC-type transport system involved in multi-copper enzyme maturation permease subunit
VSGFGATLRAEVRDLFRHPAVWAAAVAVGVAAWVFGSHDPSRDNGYVVYESALQAAAKTASFFLLGIAAVAVAGERTRGTVRWILPRPIGRVGFVLGKGAAHALLALFFLAVGVGVAWFVASDHGFGDVVAEKEAADDEGFTYVEEEVVDPAFQAATMRRRTVLATLLVLPALWTATGIGLLVSSVLGSAAGAVIVALAVALPLNYLPEVIGLSPTAARALPLRAAADFLDQLREFGRHLATAEWPAYGLLGLTGALVAVLGLPLLAALIFSRLDLTD